VVPRARKAATAVLLACLAPLAAPAQSAPGFVYENESELHTLADLNGDGDNDLVVLDKASGHIRIAEGRDDGSVLWRDNTVDSGLRPVGGLTAGPLLDPGYDQLAVSARMANRIQIIDTPVDTRLTEPQRVPDTLVGPVAVTALPIPGGPSGYDPDFHDLAYHATLQDPDDPNILHFFRNDGSGLPFPENEEGNSADLPPRRGNPIEIESGKFVAYGVLVDAGGTSTFRLLNPSDSTELLSLFDEIPGLPDEADYVYADFDGDSGAEFVFYAPGSTELMESEWTGSGLSSPTGFNYPDEIKELRVIDSAGQPELLVIHAGRDQADRVAYDGGGKFVVRESFSAAGSTTIHGALSLQDRLHLLDGDSGSASLRTFVFDGNRHELEDTQPLTALRTTAPGSTVLLFDSVPLQDPEAKLLARYNAGPWTSAFRLNASTADVESERFLGASSGLGDPRSESIQNLPSGTAGGMINQLATDNSIFFQDGAVGEITSELSVSPPSGTYDRALRPQFELEGNATVFYRTSTRVPSWTPVSSRPPLILDDTTLYAVAVDGSNRFSNVVQVDYVITGDPSTRDSDGDGLPDFAAVANGLDPLSSDDDADGDGFTDFQEVLADTDPTDDSSTPARGSVSFEYPNSFDLYAAPGIPDPGAGTSSLRSFSTSDPEPATGMAVHQPGGLLLGSGETVDNATLGYPAAYFEALDVVADELFLVAASDPNFQVDDGGFARDYGRQAAGLVKLPAMEFTPFDYNGFGDSGGYGDLATETADWRAAAQTYFNNLTRPEVTRDPIGPQSTLELLLVEHVLGQRLFAEGLSDRTGVTLTPFRAAENPLDPIAVGDPLPDPVPQPSRNRKVTEALLDQRKKQLGANRDPFYDVEGIIDTVRSELAAESTTGIRQLKTLAERLYTTSATTTGASLRQPLPALRHFIRNGNLANTGYDDAPANTNFPSSLLVGATQGVADIAGAISPRVTETVYLYVEGGEANAACPTWKEILYTANGFDPDAPAFTDTEYALLDGQGDTYPVARAFPLTVGSVFQVTGYVLDSAPCGDTALEVIPAPELAFLRNTGANDQDGDLIPDGIEERKPGASLSPFGDTDGDGYTDLQEILDGSDPDNGNDVPTDGGSPAPVVDVTPPQLRITPTGPNTAAIEFDFPSDYVPFIEFELYRTTDLTTPFSPTGDTANHTGAGKHEQVVNQNGDAEFYIFRMQLK